MQHASKRNTELGHLANLFRSSIAAHLHTERGICSQTAVATQLRSHSQIISISADGSLLSVRAVSTLHVPQCQSSTIAVAQSSQLRKECWMTSSHSRAHGPGETVQHGLGQGGVRRTHSERLADGSGDDGGEGRAVEVTCSSIGSHKVQL